MEKKNEILMTVLGVFAIVIVTLGASYAFFNYTRTSSTTASITTGSDSLKFGFTDGGNVALTEAVPMTETQGKKVSPYTININATMPKNSTVTYTIYAVNNTASVKGTKTALTNGQVRAYLTKADGSTVSGWTASKLMSSVITSGTEGVLHTYTVNTTQQTTINDSFYLRIWLDSTSGGTINATDNATGTITSGSGYTTDGSTVTSTNANSIYSLKIRVEASATAK